MLKLAPQKITTLIILSELKLFYGWFQLEQKWLKDCKLEFDYILHYQKIIVALTETDRLMKEIDKIE